MDNARYSDMRFCAQQVGSELETFEALAIQQYLSTNVIKPVKSRLAYMPLRAYFIRKIYAYLRNCPDFDANSGHHATVSEDLFTIKIPFIYEVIITIQYLHNQILDGKCGVVSGEKINDHLLLANQLKDLLYDYIDTEFPDQISDHISRNVRKVFRFVDFGQQVEKKWCTFDAFQSSQLNKVKVFPDGLEQFIRLEDGALFVDKVLQDFPEEKRLFTKIYLQRLYLTCGALFKLGVQLLLDLTNYSGKEYKNLLQFAGAYGMMRQIVNDNADFIPSYFQLSTKGKRPGDAFSDLKNRNITLPLLYYLCEDRKSIINDFLEDRQAWGPNLEEKIFEEMLDTHALLKSVQNAKLLGLITKGLLDTANPAYAPIADSCTIAEWNKFVYPCYRSNQYKYYKKTSYYRQTKSLTKALQRSLNIQYEEPAEGGSPQEGASQRQGNSL